MIRPANRGAVLSLSDLQIINRWLYLVGLRKLADLDGYIRHDESTPETCPSLYYLLHDHNGGKDPTAPDPADRWSNPGSNFVNRTADCIAAIAWGSGFDRYQPGRAGHIPDYEGWLNCDSIRWEARRGGLCFRTVARPEPGAMIIFGSDPGHHTHGVAVGHCGGIVGYRKAEWDATDPACWDAIEVANIAAYREHGVPAQANRLTTGRMWFGKDSIFVRSVMV